MTKVLKNGDKNRGVAGWVTTILYATGSTKKERHFKNCIFGNFFCSYL